MLPDLFRRSLSIALRTSNTGGGALTSQRKVAGGSRSNIAAPRDAASEELIMYTSQPPSAPRGIANGSAMTEHPSPSTPTSKRRQRPAVAALAPRPRAPAPVAGRIAHEASPPATAG